MNDLIRFLNARLDEDEAMAEAATPGLWKLESVIDDLGIEDLGFHVLAASEADFVAGAGVTHQSELDVAHIARHDPARVLREVAAKRRIVDDYRITAGAVSRVTGAELDTPGCRAMCAGRDAFRSACVSLAAVYSDHPDYRQEWVTGSSASS